MKKVFLSLFVLGFACSLIGQQTYQIQFENRSWTPSPFDANTWEEPLLKEVINERYTRLIQFEHIPSVEILNQLPQYGVELIDFYPDHTYLARLTAGFNASDADQLGIIALERLPADVKVSKDILRGDIGDWALSGSLVQVNVRYFEDLSIEHVTALAMEHDFILDEIHPEYGLMKGQIDINQLYQWAALPFVSYLGIEAAPGEPEDVEGRSLHRSNTINNLRENNLRYNADGVAIQVRDDGSLGPHIDFHGRLMLNAFGEVNTDHMDMVAGIFGGAGNVDPRAAGMASGANVYATNYRADFLDRTLDLHQQEGVLVTNSSYSNGCNAGYTDITETVDRQIFENPTLIHVFSAGNSNGNSCGNNAYGAGPQWANITGGHKVAKNVIATANLRLDVSLENSSSRGPAHDGRLKPDLAARGTAQLSTDPNNGYSPGGGTSAASPGVAGVCAQLFHAYRDMNNGETPPSALIKASLMNTANDLGNPGPDFLYGFGHINAGRAYELLKDQRYVQDQVAQDAEVQHTFTVTEDMQEVRFMLYWAEPPAAANAAKALINNLDLVVEYNGEEFLPWILDPTPDPNALNAPAQPGVDDLNNVEQVVFKAPEAGEYTVRVKGTTLPFGPKDYIVLWEVKDEEITLTYPYGGESFEPGSTEQIHWDATDGSDGFEIAYSGDGGLTWSTIGVTSANSRLYSWNIPDTLEVTPEAMIRVSRNGFSSQNDEMFNVAHVPESMRVVRACSDYIELEWPAVDGANQYDVYLLGDRYMEIVQRVDTNYAQVSVEDVLAPQWFSVRAIHENGAVGRRRNAVQHTRGVVDCDIQVDASLVEVLSPTGDLVFNCAEYAEPISVIVRNSGTTVLNQVNLSYVIEGVTMGSEDFTISLNPGGQTTLTMSSPLSLDQSDIYDLQVMIDVENDELPGNDGLSMALDMRIFNEAGEATPFEEDFETGVFPPSGWSVEGDHDVAEWSAVNVIGPENRVTRAMWLASGSNEEVYLEDAVYSRSIDLTNTPDAALEFDYAVHSSDPVTFGGKMDVFVHSFCDEHEVQSIFSSSLDGLKTSPPDATVNWEPSGADEWERLILDLSAFEGNEIVVSWVVQNDRGFRIYLDNINVRTSLVDIPKLEISASNTTPCATFELVEFEVLDPEMDVEYLWQFSDKAAPKSASGPGPHRVRFFDDGDYNVVAIASNPTNGATAQRSIDISAYDRPTARFDYSVNAKTVNFINESSRAISYSWDFGDGNTSTELNPVHTYTNNGVYQVELTATNQCTSRTTTETIEVGTSSSTDLLKDEVRVYPNPFNQMVQIENVGDLILEFEILDLEGRIIQTGNMTSKQSQQLSTGNWSSGTYILRLRSSNVVESLKLVKM